MYDAMWEENTEDIFQSITIEQALSDPPWTISLLSRMWAQTKLWERSIFEQNMNKYRYQKPSKPGTIKFRRYSNYDREKEMVRSINTKTELTLGYGRTFGRSVPCCLSGLGDGNIYYLEESQESESKEKSDG